jgi:hypothetical protein
LVGTPAIDKMPKKRIMSRKIGFQESLTIDDFGLEK